MNKTLFFRVWGVYQIHWGRDEQMELKKRISARLLEDNLRKSQRMKGLYYMYEILRMMWEWKTEPDAHERQVELFHAIRTFGKACMGEDDLYDERLDAHNRMTNNVHVCHKFCYLSVEQRQWSSMRRPRGSGRMVPEDRIYGVSAILVLPPLNPKVFS